MDTSKHTQAPALNMKAVYAALIVALLAAVFTPEKLRPARNIAALVILGVFLIRHPAVQSKLIGAFDSFAGESNQ